MSDYEPPSMEERVKSILEDAHEPTPKEIWNGRLTKISEVGPLERDVLPVNPVFGPMEQFGSYTRFHVARDDEERGFAEKEFQYDGVILSDSVGNKVSAYELKRRILVHDRDLQRWYK